MTGERTSEPGRYTSRKQSVKEKREIRLEKQTNKTPKTPYFEDLWDHQVVQIHVIGVPEGVGGEGGG